MRSAQITLPQTSSTVAEENPNEPCEEDEHGRQESDRATKRSGMKKDLADGPALFAPGHENAKLNGAQLKKECMEMNNQKRLSLLTPSYGTLPGRIPSTGIPTLPGPNLAQHEQRLEGKSVEYAHTTLDAPLPNPFPVVADGKDGVSAGMPGLLGVPSTTWTAGSSTNAPKEVNESQKQPQEAVQVPDKADADLIAQRRARQVEDNASKEKQEALQAQQKTLSMTNTGPTSSPASLSAQLPLPAFAFPAIGAPKITSKTGDPAATTLSPPVPSFGVARNFPIPGIYAPAAAMSSAPRTKSASMKAELPFAMSEPASQRYASPDAMEVPAPQAKPRNTIESMFSLRNKPSGSMNITKERPKTLVQTTPQFHAEGKAAESGVVVGAVLTPMLSELPVIEERTAMNPSGVKPDVQSKEITKVAEIPEQKAPAEAKDTTAAGLDLAKKTTISAHIDAPTNASMSNVTLPAKPESGSDQKLDQMLKLMMQMQSSIIEQGAERVEAERKHAQQIAAMAKQMEADKQANQERMKEMESRLVAKMDADKKALQEQFNTQHKHMEETLRQLQAPSDAEKKVLKEKQEALIQAELALKERERAIQIRESSLRTREQEPEKKQGPAVVQSAEVSDVKPEVLEKFMKVPALPVSAPEKTASKPLSTPAMAHESYSTNAVSEKLPAPVPAQALRPPTPKAQIGNERMYTPSPFQQARPSGIVSEPVMPAPQQQRAQQPNSNFQADPALTLPASNDSYSTLYAKLLTYLAQTTLPASERENQASKLASLLSFESDFRHTLQSSTLDKRITAPIPPWMIEHIYPLRTDSSLWTDTASIDALYADMSAFDRVVRRHALLPTAYQLLDTLGSRPGDRVDAENELGFCIDIFKDYVDALLALGDRVPGGEEEKYMLLWFAREETVRLVDGCNEVAEGLLVWVEVSLIRWGDVWMGWDELTLDRRIGKLRIWSFRVGMEMVGYGLVVWRRG
tara:strand:+ start:4395 stop:7310 length:2916 start_codon:yes stop_codon:yes gene_type:complete